MGGRPAAAWSDQTRPRGRTRSGPPQQHEERRRIAIVERLPAYRRGLAVGFASRRYEVLELARLAKAEDVDAFAVTIDGTLDWNVLAESKQLQPRAVVVALLDDSTAGAWRQALCRGADGVVSREAPIEEIVAVVEAALDGITVLPTRMMRQLVELAAEPPGELDLTDIEAVWLRAMASGSTVASLARTARYSERQMHRLIADLYRRIGATNRQEALVLAARRGILD